MGNIPRTYDYASFTVVTATTDKDIKADIAALFSNVNVCKRLIIKTNKNITCKFNTTSHPAFPIDIGDSPFQLPPEYLDIDNIFISNNSGATATIQIWLFG